LVEKRILFFDINGDDVLSLDCLKCINCNFAKYLIQSHSSYIVDGVRCSLLHYPALGT